MANPLTLFRKPRRSYPHEIRPPKPPPPPQDPSGRVAPPSEPPPGPPAYLWAETCAECWEPFSPGMIDRFFHRRRWGHNPTPLHPRPTVAELHKQNVEAARRYQEAKRG